MKNIPVIMAIIFLAAGCSQSKLISPPVLNAPPDNQQIENNEVASTSQNQSQSELQRGGLKAPINKPLDRITKKPFGLKVSPQNSPVSPEKFSGFHTGVDFEILPGEENIDVEVYAICSGQLLQKRTASGYGGLLVQACVVDSQAATVVYGHLKLAGISFNIKDEIKAGDKLGVLGQAYSTETDKERKHLHLGIHKGSSVNIRGYAQTQNELSNWLDFAKIYKK